MPSSSPEVIVAHSSDLHIDDEYTARLHGGDGTAGLACVLAAARARHAAVLILAGDTFDSHRVPQNLVERAACLIANAALPVVLLPGNHDPALDEAVYRSPTLAAVTNLHVLGVTHADTVTFALLSLEVWGRAHRDYGDMIPFELEQSRARVQQTRWRIAVGHGHYDPCADRSVAPRPSWLIGDAEIAATGADYVALGHWNRALRVGNGKVPAYYSGSPEFAGTINLVRLSEPGITVTREPLDIAREIPDASPDAGSD